MCSHLPTITSRAFNGSVRFGKELKMGDTMVEDIYHIYNGSASLLPAEVTSVEIYGMEYNIANRMLSVKNKR